jgi:iron(III) transport system ATP-binding protein
LLRVEGLEKSFVTASGEFRAVRGVSFTVQTGDFFTLLGPSGCGKTTTLHCIAGLETPDAGEIVVDDIAIFSSRRGIDVAAHRRNVGMVFQSYAIWPHMTVYENVAFPLIYGHHRPAAGDVRERVMRALALVKLEALADRPAPFLSGGQQQRVALARALVHEPPLLLFDEPLSNLDAKLRDEMRIELRQLTESLDMTTVYVTHDQIEALAMSDRIALMRDGRIVQEGPPRDVYFHPSEAFVAEFLGGSNILPGHVTERTTAVETPLGRFVCAPPAGAASGDAVDLIIRPEGFRLCDSAGDPAGAPNRIDARVETVTFVGGSVEVRLRAGDRALRAKLDPFTDIRPGAMVRLEVLSDRCAVVPSGAPSQAAARATAKAV